MSRVVSAQYISPFGATTNITSSFNWGIIEASGIIRCSVSNINTNINYNGAWLYLTGSYGTAEYTGLPPNYTPGQGNTAPADIVITTDMKVKIHTSTTLRVSVAVINIYSGGWETVAITTSLAGWQIVEQYSAQLSLTPPVVTITPRAYIVSTSNIGFNDVSITLNTYPAVQSSSTVGIVFSKTNATPTNGQGGSTTVTFAPALDSSTTQVTNSIVARGASLVPATSYYIRPFVIISGNYVYGELINTITTTEFPVISNSINTITSYNAKINMSVDGLNAKTYAFGIIYSTSNSNLSVGAGGVSLINGTGTLSSSTNSSTITIPSLTQNTTYYARAFITVDSGVYKYGDTQGFQTLAPPIPAVSGIDSVVANSFRAFVTAENLPPIGITCGVVFSKTNTMPTNGGSGSTTATYLSQISSSNGTVANSLRELNITLTDNSLYYVRAYVINNGTYIYSPTATQITTPAGRFLTATYTTPTNQVYNISSTFNWGILAENGKLSFYVANMSQAFPREYTQAQMILNDTNFLGDWYNNTSNNPVEVVLTSSLANSIKTSSKIDLIVVVIDADTGGHSNRDQIITTHAGWVTTSEPTWIRLILQPPISTLPGTVPDAPTITSVTRGNGQVTIAFNPPANNGGQTITGYTVTSSGGQTATGTSSPITITGLTNGTPYTFTVKATNAVGTGSNSSISSAVTPAISPSSPTIVSAVRGNGQATISFTPGSDGGLPATYTVTSSPEGKTGTGSASGITVSGLTNGTSYTFTVVATNEVGSSSASSPSAAVIPATSPAAPTEVSAVRGNSQATVSFTSGSTGGLTTTYTVTSSPDGKTATGSTSGITVSGLTNGTSYTFTVVATNAVGSSSASSPSPAVIPATTPGQPTSVSAARGNGQATISFTPGSTGGLAPTYTVTSNPENKTGTGSASGITVGGLTNGTSYTFTVVATNAIGTSSASAASAAVVPATTPGTPISVSAVRGNGQATISFTPGGTGGLPVTYTVTSTPGGITASGSASGIVVSGLTNGTLYTFRVVATNGVGSSSESAATAPITPATIPGAPIITNAVIGDKQATITFTPPSSNGGAAITSYTITSSPGNITTTGSSSPITITGITNNTEYTFIVTATNEVGTSAASAPRAAAAYASTSELPHAPVEVNFEVELDTSSALNIFGSEFVPPTNILTAIETLPVNALYDATINKGLIEIWEPAADPDNIYCQLASTNSSSVGGPNLTDSYKDTLKLLARGLQKVLCRDINCSQAIPFNEPKYGGDQMYTVQRDFGRLAIAVFAHYFFGHVDATTVISNDRQFIMNMLSLNNTTAGQAAAVDDTAQGHTNRYSQFSTAIKNEIDNTPITSWTNQTGSISDANLARRLVASIITKGLTGTTLKVSKVNDPAITAEADKKKELAWIVSQVVGQDATRLMNEDNTQKTRDIHQLLRFYPGDILYMNIKLNMPTVTIGSGQRSDINQAGLESSYQQQNYTLKIVLAERDAAL